MRKLLPFLAILALGCGGINPGKNPEQVDISGKVTLAGGKPVSDVVFNLQPTGTGTQAMYTVKNGEFKGKATPGRYTYYITEGPNKAAFQGIPKKFHMGAMDRQIDVASGSPLTITLE